MSIQIKSNKYNFTANINRSFTNLPNFPYPDVQKKPFRWFVGFSIGFLPKELHMHIELRSLKNLVADRSTVTQNDQYNYVQMLWNVVKICENVVKCSHLHTSSYIDSILFLPNFSSICGLQDPRGPFGRWHLPAFYCCRQAVTRWAHEFPSTVEVSNLASAADLLSTFQPPSALLNVFQAVSIGFHVLLVSKTAACRFLSSQGDFFTRRGCQVSLSLQSHLSQRGRGGVCQSRQSRQSLQSLE